MLKTAFIMLLTIAAIVPFGGQQLTAATQDTNVKTQDVAWWRGGWGGWGGYGYRGGWGGWRGYGYPYYGGYYYPYNRPYYYYPYNYNYYWW